jgi:hypothetical protein
MRPEIIQLYPKTILPLTRAQVDAVWRKVAPVHCIWGNAAGAFWNWHYSRLECELWRQAIISRARMYGPGVWREGHPCDRELVNQFRQWRRIARLTAERSARILVQSSGGRA